MKTHLTAHLSTSDRCWWIWVCESVRLCVAISPNVCICFHTVGMNHHVDWVDSPSLCYKLDSARYFVITYCMCVCVLFASPVWAVWVYTKGQLCHRERSITALGLFSVFPVVIPSKENSTFTCHFSFPKWAGKQGRWGAPGPTGNNGHIQPPSSLALGTASGKEQEYWDVCPRLWLHMMGGRRFI